MDLTNPPQLNGFSQHTHVTVEPTKLTDFWEAFGPFFEKTSSASECLYFEVFEDPAAPGKVSWVVNWAASVDAVLKVCLILLPSLADSLINGTWSGTHPTFPPSQRDPLHRTARDLHPQARSAL